jgi:hypothetical protein
VSRSDACSTNTYPVMVGAIGVFLAGGAVVSLPTPARGMAIEIYLGLFAVWCARLSSRTRVPAWNSG